jgi:hypothetical protein
MRIRVIVLLLAALPAVALSQRPIPADTNTVTYSRLPPPTVDLLDESGRQRLADRPDYTPGPGPTQFNIYSAPDRELGIPSGDASPVGARTFQLSVLVVAREIDQEYEWSSHAVAGLRQGLEQSVIDVVKYNQPVTGLAEKDATLITFGRTLLRENGVSSELWQKMVDQYGVQDTIYILQTMAAYLRVGFMLNAVDQQVPPDRHEILPPVDR